MEYRIRRADANKDAGEINLIRLQPEVMKTIASLPSEEVGAIRRLSIERTAFWG